jgi:hypothetical protein
MPLRSVQTSRLMLIKYLIFNNLINKLNPFSRCKFPITNLIYINPLRAHAEKTAEKFYQSLLNQIR